MPGNMNESSRGAPTSGNSAGSEGFAGQEDPDLTRPRRRKTRMALIGLVFLAGALASGYVYLDREVFSLRRPLAWGDFVLPEINQRLAEGELVVLLAGDFGGEREVRALVAAVDIPEVRKEVHRTEHFFCVVRMESPGSPPLIRTWVAGLMGTDFRQLPEKPFFLVLGKSDEPVVISSTGDPGTGLAKALHDVRVD